MTDHSHTHSPLLPPLPPVRGQVQIWTGLYGCADALAIASLAGAHPHPVVVLTVDSQSAQRLEQELKFFLREEVAVLPFPEWETLPYDWFSPLPELISDRLRTLARLPETRSGILVVPVAAAMQRLAPRRHVLGSTFSLSVGEHLDLDGMRTRLEQAGYQCVHQVYQHGEFAVRGAILDLFPMGCREPLRIELYDDEIESIRSFDPENQRSLHRVERIELMPAREFPFDENSIKTFRRAFRAEFPQRDQVPLYQDISKGITPGGIEFYLPLFVEETETLFDYLPDDATLIEAGPLAAAAQAFFRDVEERYEQYRHDHVRPLLPPERLYLTPAQWDARLAGYGRISLGEPVADARRFAFATRPLPDVAFQPRLKQPAEALLSFLEDFQGKTLYVAETPGHRENLRLSLEKLGIRPRQLESWSDFVDFEGEAAMMVAPMEHGLLLDEPRLAVITETQLSGERVQQRRRRKATEQSTENLLQSLAELEVDAPVVHRDHGVGRYLGLQMLEVGGVPAEFLCIQYAGNDKLYVPVSSLHLISRYVGAGPENAPLHKLGGEQWKKIKRRTLEKLRDVAAELLETQARRAVRSGHAFRLSQDDYESFAAAFQFEETPDQEAAIRHVLSDMAREQPMDRVVCGDVGFGKTEVAMRAAFAAVSNHRQVAVLVPTTLLANQHFQNFRDRFADWPVRIESLSRFVGRKQQAEILEAVAQGKVDILIGTHRLLQKDVRYHNLGLVIVDEEHRFGVRHKEHLKRLRSEVDLLTLTATPIPRTLNMALSGLRDISIIATPPPNRHPIKTFVAEWRDTLIQEACQREIRRGGQVYFLHNTIETMEAMADTLSRLMPDARIRIAHGQMPERQLEQVMLDFYHQRFNLLLCTTIIESGIDVPSANTIVIDRADQLGLAQLHQLRGRVGRSHHRAYAYLITPPPKAMTADAVKRLKAIEAAGELGAGFMLATHDMEIRGTGALLGEEQSGELQEIGFNLYTEILERTVDALKSGRQIDPDAPVESEIEIDLQIPCLIPDDYLPDIHARLVLYKRIAGAANEAELDALQVEMIDRFGLLPDPAKNLFATAVLKQRARALGIQKIEASAQGGRMVFAAQPRIDVARLIALVQNQRKTYQLQGQNTLRFSRSFENYGERLEFVHALLDQLQPADG